MQGELNFSPNEPARGYEEWLRARVAAEKGLARSLGLPIGKDCEVWLKDGVRLKGVLRLHERRVFIEGESHQATEFVVDGVRFRYREIEACTRVD